jgi:diguanylate cyclase (GGDEF)-like protein
MHTRARLLALCALLLAAAAAFSREPTFRLINVYDTASGGGGTQNFDIVQDDRGVMYVGNLGGVLEYDGVRWRLIQLPHEAPALRLRITANGRIAVGSASELGYLQRDAQGVTHYVSLTKRLPFEPDVLGQILTIDRDGDGAIFSFSEGQLLRWNGGDRLTLIDAHEPPRTVIYVGQHEVITDGGLRAIAGNALQPVAGGELFAHRKVRRIVPWRDGTLLVSVATEGLFVFDGKTAQPFAPLVSERVAAHAIADLVPLPDGRMAVVTRRGGIVIIRGDGAPDEIIDAATGLPDADVNHACLAADGSLWLAMDNAVARVDVSSPLSLIDARGGLRGSVESILRHDGVLYAGTTSGIYRIAGAPQPDSRIATQIGVKQRMFSGWSLLAVGEEILAGSNDAVFVIPPSGEPSKIAGTDPFTAYALLRSRRDPGLVYAGTDRGLALLRRGAGGWTSSGIVPGTPTMIRTLLEMPDGSLWIGTTFDGVTHRLPDGQMRQYGKNAVYPFLLAGRLVFLVGDRKVCHLDPATGRFVPDPVLGTIGDGDEISAMAEDASGRIWACTRGTGVATRGADGRYRFVPRALGAVPGTSVDVIDPESDGVIWFGSERGLVRFDPHAAQRAVAPRPPLIRDVMLNGKPVGANEALHFGRGRLRFDVAAASYDGGTTYQYRLDPIDATWSPWSDEPFTEFTNLWEGEYRLSVRTKNIRGAVSEPTVYAFRVLPPWYRTPWAWALWVVLALAAIGGFSMLRNRALHRRAAMLEEKVAEQTQELRRAIEQLREANARLEELSFDDPLTGIANRRQFDETLRAEWLRARRTQTPLALVFIDIDLFKLLNDTHGHHVGDECLVEVARFLSTSAQRSGDLVARYGGEEFALILPNTELPAAAAFAERLRNGIEALALRHEGSPTGRLTASFGVVSVVPDGTTAPQDLVVAADRALYTAKADGRNRVATAA